MPLNEDEEKIILNSSPKGTFLIILIFGFVFTAVWLVLYFGRFMAHGPVS